MGEAKRKGMQLKQLETALRGRIAAGEFGAAGEAAHYVVVIDKSPRGRELLQLLRAMPEFRSLQPLFEAEPFRFWEASALFQYVVLASGVGSPEQRSAVAATRERLLGDVLPRVTRRVQGGGGRWGLLLGLDEDAARGLDAARAAG